MLVYCGHTRDADGTRVHHIAPDRDCLPPDILAGTFYIGELAEDREGWRERYAADLQRAIAETEAEGWHVSAYLPGIIEYETE